jgi:hypothetical protein
MTHSFDESDARGAALANHRNAGDDWIVGDDADLQKR